MAGDVVAVGGADLMRPVCCGKRCNKAVNGLIELRLEVAVLKEEPLARDSTRVKHQRRNLKLIQRAQQAPGGEQLGRRQGPQPRRVHQRPQAHRGLCVGKAQDHAPVLVVVAEVRPVARADHALGKPAQLRPEGRHACAGHKGVVVLGRRDPCAQLIPLRNVVEIAVWEAVQHITCNKQKVPADNSRYDIVRHVGPRMASAVRYDVHQALQPLHSQHIVHRIPYHIQHCALPQVAQVRGLLGAGRLRLGRLRLPLRCTDSLRPLPKAFVPPAHEAPQAAAHSVLGRPSSLQRAPHIVGPLVGSGENKAGAVAFALA